MKIRKILKKQVSKKKRACASTPRESRQSNEKTSKKKDECGCLILSLLSKEYVNAHLTIIDSISYINLKEKLPQDPKIGVLHHNSIAEGCQDCKHSYSFGGKHYCTNQHKLKSNTLSMFLD